MRSAGESVHLVTAAIGFSPVAGTEIRNASESVHLVAAGAGFTSLFLIWVSVIWGLMLRNGWASTRLRHSQIHGAHMITAIMGLTLGVTHAFAQLAVPLGSVALIDVVFPFTNPVDPVGIGIGVIAMEIMIAAALSVAIQRRLGFNRWRALHSLNHVAYMLLVGHVLVSGTDVSPFWVWGPVLATWVIAVALWASTTRRSLEARRVVTDKLGVKPRGEEVIVAVDSAKCARYGFCEHEAPDVFNLLSDGRISYRVSVGVDQANDVLRAMEVCPRRAISLNRTPTAVVSAPRSDDNDRPPPRGGGGRPVDPQPHLTSPRGLRQAQITELHNRRVQS